MLSGDTAACKELYQLVPEAECAEVKTGVYRTAGFMLSHPAACALIREKARRALERLPEMKPYGTPGRVEVKIEFTTTGVKVICREKGWCGWTTELGFFVQKNIKDAMVSLWVKLSTLKRLSAALGMLKT